MTFSNILHRVLLEQEDRFEDLFQPLSPDEYAERNGWKKNEDGSYDVDGDVDLSEQGLKRLPVQFGKVSGNFWCYENQLTTLEGVPREVGGDFDCSYNPISVEELKKTVRRDYL